MRALGDPDAFLASDLGVRRALEARGMPGDPLSAAKLAESWRPWRSYALQYLWSAAPEFCSRRQEPPQSGEKGASGMTLTAHSKHARADPGRPGLMGDRRLADRGHLVGGGRLGTS